MALLRLVLAALNCAPSPDLKAPVLRVRLRDMLIEATEILAGASAAPEQLPGRREGQRPLTVCQLDGRQNDGVSG